MAPGSFIGAVWSEDRAKERANGSGAPAGLGREPGADVCGSGRIPPGSRSAMTFSNFSFHKPLSYVGGGDGSSRAKKKSQPRPAKPALARSL